MRDGCLARLKLIDLDPLVIHGDMGERDVVQLVHARQQRVAGILHGVYPVAAKKLDDQLIERLRAGAHHDLVRLDAHAPVVVQVCGDRLSKLWRSGC